MGAVDRLGKTFEAGALAQIFRAHGDDDVDPRGSRTVLPGTGLIRRCVGSFVRCCVVAHQKIDKKLSLLAARFLLEAEQFLELIDQDA